MRPLKKMYLGGAFSVVECGSRIQHTCIESLASPSREVAGMCSGSGSPAEGAVPFSSASMCSSSASSKRSS